MNDPTSAFSFFHPFLIYVCQFGYSALHLAAREGHCGAVSQLLKWGSDIHDNDTVRMETT
jgi:ankyrin repeat protein